MESGVTLRKSMISIESIKLFCYNLYFIFVYLYMFVTPPRRNYLPVLAEILTGDRLYPELAHKLLFVSEKPKVTTGCVKNRNSRWQRLGRPLVIY